MEASLLPLYSPHGGHQTQTQMADENSKSAAGVHVNSEGNRVVGGSVRADGSVRRTVRVRAGYTPVEDVRRYSAREAREQRLNDEDSAQKRPSRFGALNSVLRNNAGESTSESKKGTSPVAKETKEESHRKSPVTTVEEGDLSTDLSKLSLDPEEAPSIEPSSSVVLPSSQKPKKKYTPPQRRKKYTLADLDKQ